MGYMFDVMRFLCQDLDAKTKLSNLGIESMNDIQIIKTYAKTIDRSDDGFNSDLSLILEGMLKKSIERLTDIYFAILFPNNRENMGLPELRPYDTFFGCCEIYFFQ